MSTTTNPIEVMMYRFATEFSVSSQYTQATSRRTTARNIKPDDEPTTEQLESICGDQGAIINMANTVGLYWDEDAEAIPDGGLIGNLDTEPDTYEVEDVGGTDAVVFDVDGFKTAISMEYIEAANAVYDIDILDSLEHVRMFASGDDYPVKIPEPDGETFLLIAPRVRA